MNIKLDENLPASLATPLAVLGHDVDTVLDEQLGGADDPTVWQAAQQAQRFFVTQDLDFWRRSGTTAGKGRRAEDWEFFSCLRIPKVVESVPQKPHFILTEARILPLWG